MQTKIFVTPYLVVRDPVRSIAFLAAAFGAEETFRTGGDTVVHAEVRIGESRVMLGRAPADKDLTTLVFHLSVPEVDAAYERALRAGARSLRAPSDQDHGERSAGVEDPDGNRWWPSAPLHAASRV